MNGEAALGLRDRLRRRLNEELMPTDGTLHEWIEEEVFDYARKHAVHAKEMKAMIDRIYHSFRGLDILQPLVDDPTVTEIMVNSHEEIFIERHGKVVPYEERFESRERLEDIIQSIVAGVNRVVNESSPIVDARLRDGSRVHVVLPPLALKGPTITIRKFPEKAMDMKDLIRLGAIPGEAAEGLGKMVAAKYNLFIGGGTGSGKTTFLNALGNFIPPDERIITIEDSAELKLGVIPNWVSLETKNANTEGKGAVSIRELIRASLRMRPNRIIVGEVRGAEALDMLSAMNTGHDGSLSTGHANTVKDMLSRLETMVLSAAPLPVEVIRRQIASAIDIMVHLGRLRDKSRKVMEISEIAGVDNGELVLNPLYRFEETEGSTSGKVEGCLRPTGNPLLNRFKWDLAGFTDSPHPDKEASR